MTRYIFFSIFLLSACESNHHRKDTFSQIALPEPKSSKEMNNELSTDLLYRVEVIDIPTNGKVSEVEGNCSTAPYLGKVYRKIGGGEIVRNDTMVILGTGCYLKIEFKGYGAMVFNKAPDVRRVIFKAPGEAI